mmetsp:Transcript_34167/g.108617  ORF Transcript_34167/g.108617 Transcript_34167/m.108617 type:complete len:170 (-) Transcript_34167:244-753(-)
MVWLPDWKWKQQQEARGKGGGSGAAGAGSAGGQSWKGGGGGGGSQSWGGQSWKGGGGGGGGGGGWKSPWKQNFTKKGGGKGSKRRMEPKNTVWIGNLSEEVTFKELFEHAKTVGNAKWAEIFAGKGTGAVEFSSPEEASNAAMVLNGSSLGSAAIVCDFWEKKKEPASE